MKILLPVDGSTYTKRMLSYLAANNELLGSQNDYMVMTAIASVPPNVMHFLKQITIEDHYRDEAEQIIRPVRAFAEQNHWKISFGYVNGPAAESITQFAEEHKIDLIVMGSHGHSALANLVLGSVATGVLARSKVPVLLIR
jgi:nucleotide-binding universal stress UspA family protein